MSVLYLPGGNIIRIKNKLTNLRAKIGVNHNVEYTVKDANGRTKKLFQPWSWVSSLIHHGFLSPYHPKISGIFGYWTAQVRIANTVVNTGIATMPALTGGTGTSYGAWKYIGVGTGTAASAATDTALGAEILDSGLVRGTSTNTAVTTDVANDTLQALLSFSVTGAKAVTESGLFNHIGTAAGTMLARQTFSAINVVNGDTLQVTWKIDFD